MAITPYVFKNLKQPQNTRSGISDFILFAPTYDFVEGGIHCPEPPFVAQGDSVTITTPHEFKADRGFAKLQCAPNLSKLDAKSVGDLGFVTTELTIDCFAAGSYAELHEAAEQMLNIPLIVLAKDSNCEADLWYQLGCDCISAYCTWDFTTDTVKSGKKGYNFKISVAGSGIRLYKVDGGPLVLGD